MDVSMAVVADCANVSREGKLNIMGIFERIFVRQLPGQFPPMQLVIRLDAHFAEMNRDHTIRVQLADPDGNAVFDINGDFTPTGGRAGEISTVNHVMRFGNLPIRAVGKHQVLIWIDNDLKKELPLHVDEVPEAPPGTPGGPGAPGEPPPGPMH